MAPRNSSAVLGCTLLTCCLIDWNTYSTGFKYGAYGTAYCSAIDLFTAVSLIVGKTIFARDFVALCMLQLSRIRATPCGRDSRKFLKITLVTAPSTRIAPTVPVGRTQRSRLNFRPLTIGLVSTALCPRFAQPYLGAQFRWNPASSTEAIAFGNSQRSGLMISRTNCLPFSSLSPLLLLTAFSYLHTFALASIRKAHCGERRKRMPFCGQGIPSVRMMLLGRASRWRRIRGCPLWTSFVHNEKSAYTETCFQADRKG